MTPRRPHSLAQDTRHALIAVAALAIVTLPVGAADAPALPSTSLPPVPEDMAAAMAEGDHAAAASAMDERLADPGAQAPLDWWLFLRGRARLLAGQGEAAISDFRRIESEFPRSEWRHKAELQRADALRQLGRHAEAQALYEAATRRRLAEGRRREVALRLVDLADALTSPAPDAEPTPPAWDRARTLYERTLELEAPPDVEDRALLGAARCRKEKAEWNEAVKAYDRYLDACDPTRRSAGSPDARCGESVLRARLERGECLLRAGRRELARRAWEDLGAEIGRVSREEGVWKHVAPAGDSADPSRRDRIAAEALFARHRTFAEGNEAETLLAIGTLRLFLEAWPSAEEAARAAWRLAELYGSIGRDEESLAAADDFLAGRGFRVEGEKAGEEARRLSMTALYSRGEILMRQEKFAEATEAWTRYIARYPTGPEWARAQQGIIEAEYRVGLRHRRLREYDAARTSWTRFLERHPLDRRARSLLLDIAELSVAEARDIQAAREGKEIPEAEQQSVDRLHEAAIAGWRRLIEKYPRSAEAARAWLRTGEILETELARPEEAIEAYRKVTGSLATVARKRLQRLDGKELAVHSDRIWRTGEPARIRLQVRNVESARIHIYRLDPEAYFRKHHTLRGVEHLDLDLISADRTIEVPIEGYVKHLPIEQETVLPVEGPGVWAVAVSAGNLRATTLALRSDVDIVVKSSRRALLVFAQDMPAAAPRPGTRILAITPELADRERGSRLLEGTTGEDGVYRVRFDGERGEAPVPDGSVAVLAVVDGHVASNVLDLSGLGVSTGLQPRGWISTDRPAYRPGQEVRLRAILRDVQGGGYGFEPGAEYRLTVSDSRGRIFLRRQLRLGEYGTVADVFRLDPFAPVGDYTVRLDRAEGPGFSGGFRVEEYALQRIDLTVRFERPVVYRGEVARGTLRAGFHYGEPLADAEIRYTLPDGRTVDARTDERGEAAFSFDTSPFPAEGPLTVRAQVVGERVAATGQVHLAVQGFSTEVSTLRSVYLADEPFVVSIHTRAPDGAPVGRKLELRIVRIESTPGALAGATTRDVRRGWTEVLVARHEVETDATSGRCRRSIRIPEGGRHAVRVEGEDRFGNPVVGSRRILVSDATDDVKLRILADSDHLDVGETAKVRIVNRASAGLALVTFEGEEVIEYRLVRLQAGTEELTFEVGHELFPDFALAAALMVGNRLHEAKAEFRVDRRLQVEIEPERDTYAPGETAKLTVRVHDQIGRPVRAELSIAVVDEALLSRFGDGSGDVVAFFQEGTWRERAMRTSTSCTFSYRGRTTEVPPEVLAEAERAVATVVDNAASTWQRLNESSPVDGLQVGGVLLQTQQGQQLLVPQAGLPSSGFGRFANAAQVDLPPLQTPLSVERGWTARTAEGGPAPRPETAHWAPAVVTDDAGVATVEFLVPPIATRWRVLGVGVTRDTVVGQGSASLTSREDLVVELKAPDVLTEGDRPRLLARLHHLTDAAGTVDLKLRYTSAGRSGTLPRRVDVDGRGTIDVLFPELPPVASGAPLEVEVSAEARLGERVLTDDTVRSVPVRPWGIEFADAHGGRLAGDEEFWLELPATCGDQGRSLEISLGAGLRRLVVDEALAGPSARTQAAVAAELLGICATLDHVSSTGRDGSGAYPQLVGRGQSLVARLISSQRKDGGWAWAGQSASSDARTSALALWALAAAEASGIGAPPATRDAALAYAQKAFSAAPQQSNELKAILLHSLALHGRGDFGYANRLFRLRESLSPAALAYTALTLVALEKGPMAAEISTLLDRHAGPPPAERARSSRSAGQRCWSTKGNGAWHRATLEMTALAVIALQSARPDAPAIPRGVEYLTAARPWGEAKARGLVLKALAGHWSQSPREATDVRVAVTVNGVVVETVELDPATPRRVLRVPTDRLGKGRQRVRMELSGRGELVYTATLRGFSREVEPRNAPLFRVTSHRFRAPPPLHRGREVATGFRTVTGPYSFWENLVSKLPVGETTRVCIDVDRQVPSGSPEGARDFLVVEVPIPAGTALIEGSVSGSYEHYEEVDGRLVFYVGSRPHIGDIEYRLLGLVPGRYRVLPAVVRSAYDPSLIAVGAPREFTVLPRGERSDDDYRPTPDELYDLGERLVAAGRPDAALPLLEKLYEEWRTRLRDDPHRETVRRLLSIHIGRQDAAATVRYFEVVKEKYPDLTIPFEEVLAVGEAYRKIDEPERSLLVFRAVLEETFGRELKVVAALSESGESREAIIVHHRLWMEAPDIPASIQAYLALADGLFTKAPTAGDDADLREAGFGREELIEESIRILSRFLTLYSDDPVADQAGLSLASAYLSLERWSEVEALCQRLARRFADPRFHDHFVYSEAVAAWYLGRDEKAVELAERVAASRYPGEDGRLGPSENRDLALYIIGQIHHARQEAEKAIEYYEKVRETFPDARESIEYFRQRKLGIPEVTTSAPGSPASVEFTYRNVGEVELLAYPVDLMTLYLREKNLSGVTDVNLAGISPALRRSVRLGEGVDSCDREKEVPVELEKPGAYLLLCREDDLHASGLLLVSSLRIDVDEDPEQGRVRVSVSHRATDHYERGVDVRVVGSDSGTVISGETDPRGVFVADGVRGTATIIARKGDAQFAFHRGTTALGPREEEKRQQQEDPAATPAAGTQFYLQNVQGLNSSLQDLRNDAFIQEMGKAREGVQVKKAY